MTDYTYNGSIIHENWVDFILEANISKGDKITFETENQKRENPLTVISVAYDVGFTVESNNGIKYRIEHTDVNRDSYVRAKRVNGDSLGEINNVEISKNESQ